MGLPCDCFIQQGYQCWLELLCVSLRILSHVHIFAVKTDKALSGNCTSYARKEFWITFIKNLPPSYPFLYTIWESIVKVTQISLDQWSTLLGPLQHRSFLTHLFTLPWRSVTISYKCFTTSFSYILCLSHQLTHICNFTQNTTSTNQITTSLPIF